MDFIRKITNSDLLAGIMNIPENMRHKKVEIIVLPCEAESEDKKNELRKNVKGLLHKYANKSYIPLEQSVWAEAVRESHENS